MYVNSMKHFEEHRINASLPEVPLPIFPICSVNTYTMRVFL